MHTLPLKCYQFYGVIIGSLTAIGIGISFTEYHIVGYALLFFMALILSIAGGCWFMFWCIDNVRCKCNGN